ncbi:MAG: putative NDP-sugar dehydratase or epimerase/NAD binding domain 4 [Mucilaginibacter sp.]|nr:putative NDP-sugar dehydratase or epimerase/NAD binding domain 4 [Mucilaginibacter sp.]
MKRILITGATGFIGSTLFNHLKNKGHELFVIDNLSFGNKNYITINDDMFFEEDIRNKASIAKIIQNVQPQWVIHLAAIHFIPYCNQHPFESSEININGTKNILDACKEAKSIEKVFFASTAAVYPILNDAYVEEGATGPLDIYGLSKLTGEYLCNEFHLATGIPTVICRFFNAFGPNETNPHLIPAIQDQLNSGIRTIKLGNLEPKRDFIHTTDMSAAVDMLMNKFDKGIDVFNLGRGIEYSVVEIVDAFSRQLNEEIIIEVDPLRVRKTERMHLLADISKLKNFTGWEPKVSIDEGIKTLIGQQLDFKMSV